MAGSVTTAMDASCGEAAMFLMFLMFLADQLGMVVIPMLEMAPTTAMADNQQPSGCYGSVPNGGFSIDWEPQNWLVEYS